MAREMALACEVSKGHHKSRRCGGPEAWPHLGSLRGKPWGKAPTRHRHAWMHSTPSGLDTGQGIVRIAQQNVPLCLWEGSRWDAVLPRKPPEPTVPGPTPTGPGPMARFSKPPLGDVWAGAGGLCVLRDESRCPWPIVAEQPVTRQMRNLGRSTQRQTLSRVQQNHVLGD